MLVGRNVQELDKPPHQEQQAGIYDTRGCHVKFTHAGSFHASSGCHLLQESAESKGVNATGAPKDRRFLISMKTS